MHLTAIMSRALLDLLTAVSSLIVIAGAAFATQGWYRARIRLRVWMQRDSDLVSSPTPRTRYCRHVVDRSKSYVEVWIENASSHPFHFLRADILSSGMGGSIPLTKGNDGVTLFPAERMSFALILDGKNGLREVAALTVHSFGWTKTYFVR